MLKRRKSNSWQAGVKDRRAKASRYLNDPEFKKVCDEENRKKFKERQAMEEPEPTSGFRIIVPITPFGMPEYDGGERFDLRLPYVDNGWVDEDADPMKQFRRFIGLVRMTTMTTMTTKMISLSLSLALRALPVCPFITRRTRRPSRTTATAPRGERGRERNE